MVLNGFFLRGGDKIKVENPSPSSLTTHFSGSWEKIYENLLSPDIEFYQQHMHQKYKNNLVSSYPWR